jgi:hypothetical protein
MSRLIKKEKEDHRDLLPLEIQDREMLPVVTVLQTPVVPVPTPPVIKVEIPDEEVPGEMVVKLICDQRKAGLTGFFVFISK